MEVSLIGGKAVGEVFKALFLPTADYLGEEIKKQVQDRIDSAKARKRLENLSVHMERVQARIAQEPTREPVADANVEQLAFFEDWLSGAQDVDPNDAGLSQLWEEMLFQFARGRPPKALLVGKLRSLSPEEAHLLLRIASRSTVPRDESERYFLAKLRSAELVRLSPLYLAAMLVSIVTTTIVMLVLDLAVMVQLEVESSLYLWSLLIGSIAVAAFVWWRFIFPRISPWRATWIGRELTGYALPVAA